MHPVLLHIRIPASWSRYFGPKAALYGWWKVLLAFFVVAFLTWMWATNPERKQPSRALAWLSGLAVAVLGIPLLGIGLVKLGEIKLHTYGVMLSTGFLTGIALAVREARRQGENAEHILDLSFWILISAIVGSRVLYIIVTWHEYKNDLGKLFRVWEGGLVFYGGLIAAVLTSWWYVRKHNLRFWKIADIMIPSVSLGQSFGRLGCFSAGCCFGKASSLPWAVTFTQGLATRNTPLHPTQLYESFGDLTLFFILVMVRSRKKFHGQVLIAYLLLYPLLRFTVELFRGDKIRGYAFEMDLIKSLPGPEILTSSQIVSIALFALGLFLLYRRRKAAAS